MCFLNGFFVDNVVVDWVIIVVEQVDYCAECLVDWFCWYLFGVEAGKNVCGCDWVSWMLCMMEDVFDCG